MQKRSVGSKIGTLIFMIIVFICLKEIYDVYKENYFNEFVKAEYISNISEFKRDSQVKYDKYDSYRITSPEYNDAMFYKTVQVIPNTAYRVSCMVKTEGVETQSATSIAGAGICISDTTECSNTITGTSDGWQKIEFLFNSKNRTEVNIGFRLGAYSDNCKGTAWFSDLKLEIGSKSVDTHWKMACFIVENLDVNIQVAGSKKHIVETLSNANVQDIKENIARAKNSMEVLSGRQMTMEYDIIEIKEPITDVTYEVENGYYLSPANMAKVMEPYIVNNDYDYIYVIARFGNIMHNDRINEVDWVGLGGMDYLDIGFSNIRMPNDDNSYIYRYDSRINTFPEEVYIHEFLHTMERISEENGLEFPYLHDNEKYGYQNQKVDGLRTWYGDFMTKKIKSNGTYIGLDPKVYSIKPIHQDAFSNSITVEFDDNPENVFDEIRHILKAFTYAIELQTE